MSASLTDIYFDSSQGYASPYLEPAMPLYNARSIKITMLTIPSLLLSGMSWMADGNVLLRDFSFYWLVVASIIILIHEAINLPYRYGAGAAVIAAGSLIWYCHDYLTYWPGLDGTSWGASSIPYEPWMLAKGTFFLCLFLQCAYFGLFIRTPKWIPEAVRKYTPDVIVHSTFFIMVLCLFAFSISPFFFAAECNGFEAVWKTIMGGRSGNVEWIYGRSGNENINWSGYITQVMETGQIAGILSMFYVLGMRGDFLTKTLAVMIWLLEVGIAFGNGARGDMIVVSLPVVGLLVLRYYSSPWALLIKLKWRGYVYGFLVLIFALWLIQVQGKFRNDGYSDIDVGQVELFESSGNLMFTESIAAFSLFPDHPHPFATLPGEGFFWAIPWTAQRFAIGWIPRVIWPGKPGIDDIGKMLNTLVSGGDSLSGTGGTVCAGIQGHSYMYFGTGGVIAIGLLFGWMCKIGEECLRRNLHRPVGLMFSLGLLTYLFRAFRDLSPHQLYPVFIGVGCVSIMLCVLQVRWRDPAVE